MSIFELTSSTKAKLSDVDVLSQKNRPPDANPGVSLAFSVEMPNTALTMLDGFMRSALYTKNESTETPPQKLLEGVEPVSDLPNLTRFGSKIGKFSWALELTGYTVTFDWGTGGKSNLVIEDAKVDSMHIFAKEGGTIILSFKVEANDIDEAVFGKLATLKSRDVYILLAAPVVEGLLTEADVFPNAPPARHVTEMHDEAAWPFPKNTFPSEAAAQAEPAKAVRKGGKVKTVEQAFADTAKH